MKHVTETAARHLIHGDEYRPRWENRRRVIFCTIRNDHLILWAVFLSVCFLALADLLNAATASVFITIVICAYGRSVLVVGSYVFGAVWDDRNYMQAIKPGGAAAGGYSEGGTL